MDQVQGSLLTEWRRIRKGSCLVPAARELPSFPVDLCKADKAG